MKIIQIINGPNLNLLGRREPGVYGSRSFEDYLKELRLRYPDVQLDYFQSNCEGAIIDEYLSRPPQGGGVPCGIRCP